VPNLATTAAAPLCAYPNHRSLTVLTTATLLFSDKIRYLTNRKSVLYAYVPPFTGLALCKRLESDLFPPTSTPYCGLSAECLYLVALPAHLTNLREDSQWFCMRIRISVNCACQATVCGAGGVGVCRRTFSFDNTLSGLNGTSPALRNPAQMLPRVDVFL
jgi:hypothetical protein